jgi:2-C-methyl-D-erythritol 4-phosphate cytidylyltransferase
VQENDLIVIHDAARAFLSTDLLNRLILHAQEFGSASPYISSGLLINDGNEIIEKGIVEIQTPQIFDFKNLMKSYKEASLDGFNSVDTTECISKYTKIIPQVIEGETLNKKITYKQDLDELKEILEV